MSGSRELILERVRDAITGTTPPEPTPRDYRHAGARDAAARIDMLCERLEDYRALARRVPVAQLRETVADVLATHGAARIGIPAALPADWRPAGVELIEDGPALDARELDRLDGVLTGCTVAIAETATIVLAGGPLEGRRALTLIPDLHVCVVGEEQIVELVPEAMARLDDLASRERRPLTFISGPSATSDIELSRIEGVHGPRTLVVLIVTGESDA